MEKTPPSRFTVLGIDPGRNTGLYSVSIPRLDAPHIDRALTLQEFQQHAHWLGNAVVSLSTRKGLRQVDAWREMQERIDAKITGIMPDLIVLEHPADAMPKWTPGGHGGQRGTLFTIGMYFGFAAVAAVRATYLYNRPIALVPVSSSKAKQREGWMPRVRGRRNNLHTQDKETTLRQCREIAHAIGINSGGQRSEDVDALSEHELMALGVLTYYVTHKVPSQWGDK